MYCKNASESEIKNIRFRILIVAQRIAILYNIFSLLSRNWQNGWAGNYVYIFLCVYVCVWNWQVNILSHYHSMSYDAGSSLYAWGTEVPLITRNIWSLCTCKQPATPSSLHLRSSGISKQPVPLSSFGSSWWKWKMMSAFLSLPGTVLVQSFFMKNTW